MRATIAGATSLASVGHAGARDEGETIDFLSDREGFGNA
jgi:hypothetical protein